MTKENQTIPETNEEKIEIQKYEIDKKFQIQERKLQEASNIIVGNSNLTAISMMAEKFSKAGDMIPKEFQNQPEKCFAAIYKGASIGLDAFTSLQRIAVVNGRATIWGDAALAVVKNTGELEHFKEYYGVWVTKENLTPEELAELDNQEVIKKFNGIVRKTAGLNFENKNFGAGCELKRKGGELMLQFFTVQDATTAGLWSKDVWKKYPQRMIMYRPRAYALRDAFPDVLEGLYIKEEMEGAEDFAKKNNNLKTVNNQQIATEAEAEERNKAQIKLFNADKKTN
jgi:RecT family